jgi:hypothetical protein
LSLGNQLFGGDNLQYNFWKRSAEQSIFGQLIAIKFYCLQACASSASSFARHFEAGLT